MEYLLKNKLIVSMSVLVIIAALLGGGGIYFTHYYKNNTGQTPIKSSVTTPVLSTAAISDFLIAEISGAVQAPGVYKLEKGSRVADLLKKAGGYSENAFFEWVNRNLNTASVIEDSSKIYIPFSWDAQETPIVIKDPVDIVFDYKPPVETLVNTDTSKSSSVGESSAININTCTKDQLINLKGIGDAYATKILNNRPYANVDELISKSKVPASVVHGIESSLTFK